MMPAGKYYIGDLCYVMSDDWDEVCDLTIKDCKVINGEFEMKDGRRFAMYSTKYGDGLYRSNIGTKHAVDSGTIGCILVDDIIDIPKFEVDGKLGTVVTINRSFSTAERDGLIVFGDVIINTDSDEWYDDLDEEEYSEVN
jgi:hypothetical protein